MRDHFHSTLCDWFERTYGQPTAVQMRAWPVVAEQRNALLLAPTGSGKTLAAFLVAIDRLMFGEERAPHSGVRVLYVSPLKALGVDIERNLKTPIAQLCEFANSNGSIYRRLKIGVRSGDTPAAERAKLGREPPDILITTPESLFLLLTSRARDVLRNVETVIVDEIHSLVATKRGAHLFASLERLEALRREHDRTRSPMQRIGLSATQRPLDEVARLLGGAELADDESALIPRPVEIVEAGRKKQLELTIEVPVEDLAALGRNRTESPESAEASRTPPTIWPAIHPRLVELIRSHRSTILFVNNRRLAERLAGAINQLADEELALAHHGSLSKDARQQIEWRLKNSELRAIVATSSLELGIDMGAVDLVIQIEAPPSIASGLQRIGRAGHQVGAPSKGVIFPKYRGDLLACSAAAERMRDGHVEETFYPRNPLDVLAQQIVAMVALGPIAVSDVFRTLKAAAPFHDLPRSAFVGALDLLSGRYPSAEFAELRPRFTWDRESDVLSPRASTHRLAVFNAGTIPDRGLYGVFLQGDDGQPGSRVGELDEEMVFETRVGDVFQLGASSWRAIDITHDRVLVVAAPGEPGRMPFWRGDGPGRPYEFGVAIGSLARRLVKLEQEAAQSLLVEQHGLDERAAHNLLAYLHEQLEQTGELPSDKLIIVECFVDEVGDWRVVLLSPFGARVHAAWATAIASQLHARDASAAVSQSDALERDSSQQADADARSAPTADFDVTWTDDGIVFRLPETDEAPDLKLFFPPVADIEDLVVRDLDSTALFAARFRENAARALLLPRRSPGRRTPLWLQRRKSADLLKVAKRFPEFPILLETYRETLRDVFDLTGLKTVLADVERRVIRVKQVVTKGPSPFAAAVLFTFSSNFMYDGDVPPAERRAQALSLDFKQLRELLGEAELRELLDADVIVQFEREQQRLVLRETDSLIAKPKSLTTDVTTNASLAIVPHGETAFDRTLDATHDLLREIGELSCEELALRIGDHDDAANRIVRLKEAKRIVEIAIAGQTRFAAVEDASRYRDALGIQLPSELAPTWRESVSDPLGDLVARYARTHGPFRLDDVAARFGIGPGPIRLALQRLALRERVIEGEFLPSGRGREWCDVDALRIIKQRSLAKLRRQVEPVEAAQYARFLLSWQSVSRPRRGLDGLLDVIQQLQGLALPFTVLEQEILPARVSNFKSSDLDELLAAGEVFWRGCGTLGSHDGRVALYLADSVEADLRSDASQADPLEPQIIDVIRQRGALFFETLLTLISGFPNDLLDAIWRLVWAGRLTNDTLRPVRSLFRSSAARRSEERRSRPMFRSRRTVALPGSEGRWALPTEAVTTDTERLTARALQLVERHGVLTREAVVSEGIDGGFSSVYPVLKALEEAGRLRRGYFIAGLGAAQFAWPGADERLRADRNALEDEAEVVVMSAVDPANPYGAAITWPELPGLDARPQRAAGAKVVIWRGHLLAHLSRSRESLLVYASLLADPDAANEVIVKALVEESSHGLALELATINGEPATKTPFAALLLRNGFQETSRGLLYVASRRR